MFASSKPKQISIIRSRKSSYTDKQTQPKWQRTTTGKKNNTAFARNKTRRAAKSTEKKQTQRQQQTCTIYEQRVIFAWPQRKANAFTLRPSLPIITRCNVFSWRKNRKAHPGVCLAPMKSWQFFFKIKSEVLDWSKLISSKTRWFLLVNGDIDSQLEGWLGCNRFGYGQHQLELSSTKPRGHVPTLGGG